jgi:hypothetical protein
VDRGITGDAECEKILIRIEQPDLRPPAGVWHVESVDSEEEIQARQLARLIRDGDGWQPSSRALTTSARSIEASISPLAFHL